MNIFLLKNFVVVFHSILTNNCKKKCRTIFEKIVKMFQGLFSLEKILPIF
ncbi:Protein of unknown function [Gryllus bimaculatus]|nr:Protein of unknown function [Gryllus bimaculatus]